MKKLFAIFLLMLSFTHFSSFQSPANADSHCLEYLLGLPTSFWFDFDDFENPFNCFFSNGGCFVCTQFDRSMYEQ